MIKVRKLYDDAVLPKRATDGSVGYDLFACLSTPLRINPGSGALIPTGIMAELPAGLWAKIEAKSGLASKSNLICRCGVIDPDYRGEWKVSIFNLGEQPYEFNHGEKVAQFVLMKTKMHDIVEVNALSETIRGEGGFGSTGT